MGFFDTGGDDEEADDGPTFDDVWAVTPEGGQQWEYRVLDTGAIRGTIRTGPHESPEDVFNEFGKEGWELVETVENIPVGDGAKEDGTVQFLFKRPASYERRDGVTDDGR